MKFHTGRQLRRKKLKIRTFAQRRESGRPEIVYGKKCKQRMVEHQIRIADLALHFFQHTFEESVKVVEAALGELRQRRSYRWLGGEAAHPSQEFEYRVVSGGRALAATAAPVPPASIRRVA